MDHLLQNPKVKYAQWFDEVQNGGRLLSPMNHTQRHADDITHYLLRSIGVLLVLSAAGVLALVIVKPTSYWEGRAKGTERAPMPCVKDRSMQL